MMDIALKNKEIYSDFNKFNEKILFFFFFLCLFLISPRLTGQNVVVSTTHLPKSFTGMNLNVLGGYRDFTYNSTTAPNYNRYTGHSKLYEIGGNNLKLRENLYFGVFLYRLDTSVRSQLLLNPNPLSMGQQIVHSNNILAHVLKVIKPQLMVDLALGYGLNSFNSTTQLPLIAQNGFAQSYNQNWFGVLTGIYNYKYEPLSFNTSISLVYSQLDQGKYQYAFLNPVFSQTVEALENKATLLLENIEMTYHANPQFQSFVNAGLIQVLQYQNSRALITSAVLGTLPLLNLDENGYKLGGGISFSSKNWALRLEEQFNERGGIFQSYLTLGTLRFNFS